jgi:chromate reductase
VVGASTSEYGALWAQDHLRKTLGIAGARVLDAELAVGRAHERLEPEGVLTDADTRERLAEIVGALALHVRELAAASQDLADAA